MLAKANQRELYDELVELDLTEYLEGQYEQFDLIISADTMVYIGDLQSTFRAAAQAMRAGAWLVFTLEKLCDDGPEPGYRLNRFGRYVHCESCIRTWLADCGLEVRELREESLRREGDDAVCGLVVAATK